MKELIINILAGGGFVAVVAWLFNRINGAVSTADCKECKNGLVEKIDRLFDISSATRESVARIEGILTKEKTDENFH